MDALTRVHDHRTAARPRRAAPLGALLLGLALLPPALVPATPAAAARCPGEDRPVQVRLDTRFDTARLDHTRGRDTINRLHQKTLEGEATIPTHGSAVGLTTTRSEFRFNTRTQYYRRSDGRYCVYLRAVEAELNQVDTMVYVSREFPKGSCNYNVTYQHEKKHVGIYYFTQKDYAPRIRAALARLVRNVNPRIVRSPADARTVHAAEINAGIAPLLAEMEAERKRRNALLDTPENYAAERAKCPTW
ncbi:hypothetical protein [Roseospira goensis]|uniref:DUF922 domain-containing protein n=1 Tax=Roseospira goensis TaxID=391922 RepID=A0A7W6WJH1_9PROT|nr:hypothetical protein [Roseospira goensis]MBB4285211.1 hypothetical protein [Roseospira goensis]